MANICSSLGRTIRPRTTERRRDSITSWKDFLIDFQHRINEGTATIVHKVSPPLKPPLFLPSLILRFLFTTRMNESLEKNCPGIYLFVVDDDIDMTYEQVMTWNSVDESGAGFKEYKALFLKQGDFLYLGAHKNRLYSGSGNISVLSLRKAIQRDWLFLIPSGAFSRVRSMRLHFRLNRNLKSMALCSLQR